RCDPYLCRPYADEHADEEPQRRSASVAPRDVDLPVVALPGDLLDLHGQEEERRNGEPARDSDDHAEPGRHVDGNTRVLERRMRHDDVGECPTHRGSDHTAYSEDPPTPRSGGHAPQTGLRHCD